MARKQRDILKIQSGFTMAEILITLAVLGLLSAIAVPNYIKQVEISRQKEAKATLAQLSSAMKTFFSEYAFTTPRFDVNGFNPDGTLNYVYGFDQDNPPLNTVPYTGNAACIDTFSAVSGTNCGSAVGPFSYTHKWQNNTSATVAGTIAHYTSAYSEPHSFPGGGWTAYAVAQLNPAGNSVDAWSIDSQDDLKNTTPGL